MSQKEIIFIEFGGLSSSHLRWSLNSRTGLELGKVYDRLV